MVASGGERKKVTLRESSVVSDVTTTDTSEMFYDARESPGDELSASFKRDHVVIPGGKSPPPTVGNFTIMFFHNSNKGSQLVDNVDINSYH